MDVQTMQWESKYELGIEDIDFQHHCFFNLIKRLDEELGRADHLDYQASLVNELNAYARFHFISEENLMRRAGFPELDAHRRHHRELIEQLSYRQLRLTTKQSGEECAEIVSFLKQWFFAHTGHEDRLFADFLARAT